MIHGRVRVLDRTMGFMLDIDVLPRETETVYIGAEEFTVTKVVHEFTLGNGTERTGGSQKVLLVVEPTWRNQPIPGDEGGTE